MSCNDCDFHPDQGGTCRGLVKNQEAKVPFSVCPHAGDIAQIREYENGVAVKLAETIVSINSTTLIPNLQHVSSSALYA